MPILQRNRQYTARKNLLVMVKYYKKINEQQVEQPYGFRLFTKKNNHIRNRISDFVYVIDKLTHHIEDNDITIELTPYTYATTSEYGELEKVEELKPEKNGMLALRIKSTTTKLSQILKELRRTTQANLVLIADLYEDVERELRTMEEEIND